LPRGFAEGAPEREKGGTGIVDDLFEVVPALIEEFGG
jgi:electron transfer flavoprotein alpha subunit